MLLFSTVLFVDGNPVGYEIRENGKGYELNPAENPNREIYPPVMRASLEENHWRVDGTTDQDLIDQVIEDVSNNAVRFSSNRFTAAP